MIFIAFLIIVTAAVAIAAAYFSVYGLALLFASATIPVIIMGSALEAGKLVAASFLYRFWNDIGIFLKTYLIFAILTLMLITSMGIFGFLTSAYQKDNLPLESVSQTIELKQEELDRLILRKDVIDSQISGMPATYVSAKQRLVTTFKEELDDITPRISVLQLEISELKQTELTVETKIGPILFLADTLNFDRSKALLFFVLLIVIVFDPLAVALTIAANVAILKHNNTKQQKDNVVASIIEPQSASLPANTLSSPIGNPQFMSTIDSNNVLHNDTIQNLTKSSSNFKELSEDSISV